jgi:ribosomal protein L17
VGNHAARGNPLAKRVGKLRSALVEAVSEQDVREIIGKMVALAKSGDVLAARLVFDRLFGKSEPADLLARLDELETLLRGDV